MDESQTPDFRQSIAETAANILLEIEAVHIRPEEPFTFTSGRLSPVYVDCRKIISFPRARKQLMEMGVELLAQKAGFEQFDAVAGGETAGIPFAAWIADLLGLPMLYIRKKPSAATPGSREPSRTARASCWSRIWRRTAAPSFPSSTPSARPVARLLTASWFFTMATSRRALPP